MTFNVVGEGRDTGLRRLLGPLSGSQNIAAWVGGERARVGGLWGVVGRAGAMGGVFPCRVWVTPVVPARRRDATATVGQIAGAVEQLQGVALL